MKKLLSFIIMLSVLAGCLTFGTAAVNESEVEVRAKAAVLMDASTGQVLYSFNENEKLYPASVTKIMPLLLFMEALDSGKIALEDKVTASVTAAGKGGSQIWLKEGETMTVDELLRATAIASANDACTALGEHIAGSETGFVKMMNDRAKELGMVNTNFVNCSGLDDDTVEHLTTAYDIALMSKELLSHERIKTYTTVWMDSLRNGETQLVNTNKLVRFYSGTTGLKTGTTSKAGHCLSASAERDGLHLIAVVMGAENSNDRFEGAKAMLNWGFANFETVTPQIDSSLFSEVEIIRGVQESIRPVVTGVVSLTLKAGEKSQLETEIELCENAQAPIEKNQTLGTVTLKIGEREIASYNLVSENFVEKTNIGHIMVRFLSSLAKSA
jgi:D-alanyl-D-alanine carboxypeptidase (penicillin-binding protein 5/6)